MCKACVSQTSIKKSRVLGFFRRAEPAAGFGQSSRHPACVQPCFAASGPLSPDVGAAVAVPVGGLRIQPCIQPGARELLWTYFVAKNAFFTFEKKKHTRSYDEIHLFFMQATACYTPIFISRGEGEALR